MKKVLSVSHLSKNFRAKIKKSFLKDIFAPTYRQITAVSDVSFDIHQGETVAFLGPNGAGKTTTIKMLTGLIYPTSGEIEAIGFIPQARSPEYLSRIGLVMGNKSGLNWDLTPRQSFKLFKHIYKIPEAKFQENLKKLTEMLAVENHLDVQIRKLSLGERMKMELIGSILHGPEILFLDEPTIGLDIISKQKIREFLREIQEKENITILLTSHDMDDIEKVCDRVIIVNHGKKVYDDNLKQLIEKYNSSRFVRLIFDGASPTEENTLPATVIENGPNSIMYNVPASKLAQFMAESTNKYTIADIDIISVPLESIIADIYNEKS